MTLSGFAPRLDLFQQRPLERLRYTVTETNLLRHLDPTPQRVLDVAGGNGAEAVRLAALGHEVTVLDPAGAMLHRAIEIADSEGVADRLHVVQAGALDAPEVFAGHEFDLVLCHNLLHYVGDADDRRDVLAAVTAPLRARGLLSVLGPNTDFDPVHAAVRELDPDRAARSMTDPQDSAAAEVMVQLVRLGVAELVRYGVRCVADLVDEDRLADPVFYADLLRLEQAMANQMPHLLTARYFHLLARR